MASSSSGSEASSLGAQSEDTSSPSLWAWLRVQVPLLLALPDLLILYGGLLLGYKIRLGGWMLPHATEWGVASLTVLGVYMAALAASGVYRMPPRLMGLNEALRIGGWLVGAWGVSITLTYALNPATVPPRSVMAVLGLVALVGVLGVRAVLRRVLELVSPTPGEPAPGVASTELRLEDLVPREATEIDRLTLRNMLSDRTVLVTGAGGSIGSELSRQLADLCPFRLAFVDVSEHNLYRLETALRAGDYDGDMDFCIADVRDTSIMDGLFRSIRPDVVIHTAAYKHVPLMERHPVEAFRNNTTATANLLDLCEQHEVDEFVFVSTDKAVNPTSVLGATKQLAEWYVRTGTGPTRCTTVRFGNVFGTQGSVVPRFEKRLADGDPLPVTHPDMERYFMSPKEACSLVLQTLLFDAHPTYIFRMGDPIRIQWLAERFVEHWYPHVNPETMIDHVGRRPGEKLAEELTHAHETAHPTDHPSVLGIKGPVPYSRSDLEAHLQRLQSVCDPTRESREQLRHLLLDTHPDGHDGAEVSSSDRSSVEL
ncbi:MAG: polysaccharide biosynthesis protein [Salinibacter sp.]|uniref:polysaccharide biosynthesis protein n=1 Tax=Salinibacter sp. TaxID=2065818 RepID=UPI0035D45839